MSSQDAFESEYITKSVLWFFAANVCGDENAMSLPEFNHHKGLMNVIINDDSYGTNKIVTYHYFKPEVLVKYRQACIFFL